MSLAIDSSNVFGLCEYLHRVCVRHGVFCVDCDKYSVYLAASWLETWSLLRGMAPRDLDLEMLKRLSDMMSEVLGLAMEGRYVYVFESDRDVDDAVKRLFGGSGG